MLLSTTDIIPGEYDIIGIINAATTNLPHLSQIEKLYSDAMSEAHASLAEQAAKLGGNGVIGIRYSFNSTNNLLITGTVIRTK